MHLLIVSSWVWTCRECLDPFDNPECEAFDVFVNEALCVGKGNKSLILVTMTLYKAVWSSTVNNTLSQNPVQVVHTHVYKGLLMPSPMLQLGLQERLLKVCLFRCCSSSFIFVPRFNIRSMNLIVWCKWLLKDSMDNKSANIEVLQFENGLCMLLGHGEDYQVQLAVGQCPRSCIHYVTPSQRIVLEELLDRCLFCIYTPWKIFNHLQIKSQIHDLWLGGYSWIVSPSIYCLMKASY